MKGVDDDCDIAKGQSFTYHSCIMGRAILQNSSVPGVLYTTAGGDRIWGSEGVVVQSFILYGVSIGPRSMEYGLISMCFVLFNRKPKTGSLNLID